VYEGLNFYDDKMKTFISIKILEDLDNFIQGIQGIQGFYVYI